MRLQLFFLLLLIIAIAGCHQHPPYGNNKAAGRYYNIRGIRMYTEVYGKGQPLLMIHGNNGSISTFEFNITHFADDYKVILADARSQGRSADKNDSLTFEMMADDYAALLDSMHIDSAYVLGWSDGGISGLLLAIRHPEKVKKLAVSGANLWPDTTAIEPADWRDNIKEFDSLELKQNRTVAERQKIKMLKLDLTEPHIALHALHQIKCPALVISGDHDMIRLQHTHDIFKNIPHAHLWVIPNSSHYTLMEHPRRFNAGLSKFFSTPFSNKETATQ
ncbi:hypothetical protein A8C56_02630 [Niabella ginsenosidivorans]|uniref:AB hydrolase-1 domain-containing protein n=1 Tax=Niabella ginsenosidivorans TaxID=1176587 RepID=A0A1A9HZX5_9BACT|nr:alpha/beta hydrolase [Niabella ginsenosidivorans]ANH80021.1 hypothetical protein A8C56_02630 [Niabella ginsenosidivorans]